MAALEAERAQELANTATIAFEKFNKNKDGEMLLLLLPPLLLLGVSSELILFVVVTVDCSSNTTRCNGGDALLYGSCMVYAIVRHDTIMVAQQPTTGRDGIIVVCSCDNNSNTRVVKKKDFSNKEGMIELPKLLRRIVLPIVPELPYV